MKRTLIFLSFILAQLISSTCFCSYRLKLISISSKEPISSFNPETSKLILQKDLTNFSSRIKFWKDIYIKYSDNDTLCINKKNPSEIFQVFYNTKPSTLIYQTCKRLLSQPRHQIILLKGRRNKLKNILIRAQSVLPIMKSILKNQGLPEELAWLPAIESEFSAQAISPAGAYGYWQLMPYHEPSTALRSHPVDSTKKAAALLKEAYKELKDWPLAITAYNYGLSGLKKARENSQAQYLDDLIQKAQGKNRFGFDSQNFYAHFRAFVEVASSSVAKNP